jgi:TM2 domain-containing membrane protein YozV
MIKIFQIFFLAIILINLISYVSSQDPDTLIVDDEFYKDPIYDTFLFVRNITCTVSNCPTPNQCVQGAKVCRCGSGYANYVDNSTTIQVGGVCLYERKKQLTAFLLQFFVFFVGAGQFYVGNIQYAVPQLILSILGIVLGIIKSVMKITFSAGEDEKGEEIERPCLHTIIWWSYELVGATVFYWWLADIITFGMNNYVDGKGIPLIAW